MGRRAAALVVGRGLQTASGGGQLCSKPSQLRQFRMRNGLESNGSILQRLHSEAQQLLSVRCVRRAHWKPARQLSSHVFVPMLCVEPPSAPRGIHVDEVQLQQLCHLQVPLVSSCVASLGEPRARLVLRSEEACVRGAAGRSRHLSSDAGGGKAARTPARRKPPDALKPNTAPMFVACRPVIPQSIPSKLVLAFWKLPGYR